MNAIFYVIRILVQDINFLSMKKGVKDCLKVHFPFFIYGICMRAWRPWDLPSSGEVD
jgi:hypothetical protein